MSLSRYGCRYCLCEEVQCYPAGPTAKAKAKATLAVMSSLAQGSTVCGRTAGGAGMATSAAVTNCRCLGRVIPTPGLARSCGKAVAASRVQPCVCVAVQAPSSISCKPVSVVMIASSAIAWPATCPDLVCQAVASPRSFLVPTIGIATGEKGSCPPLPTNMLGVAAEERPDGHSKGRPGWRRCCRRARLVIRRNGGVCRWYPHWTMPSHQPWAQTKTTFVIFPVPAAKAREG